MKWASSKMNKTDFIQRCISGDASLKQIGDEIEYWHKHDVGQELWEYLGMTKKEYAMWVKEDEFLPYIVKAHRENSDLKGMIEGESDLELAARGANDAEVEEALKWLKKRKKI